MTHSHTSLPKRSNHQQKKGEIDMTTTPRAVTGEMRLWYAFSGPAYSPTPMQDIYGAQIVQKVIKALTVSSPVEMVMQRGTIVAWDAGLQKLRIVNAPDDDVYGVLI